MARKNARFCAYCLTQEVDDGTGTDVALFLIRQMGRSQFQQKNYPVLALERDGELFRIHIAQVLEESERVFKIVRRNWPRPPGRSEGRSASLRRCYPKV